MKKDGVAAKYQIVWNIVSDQGMIKPAFDDLVANAGSGCTKISVVGKKEEIEKLCGNGREILVQYIQAEEKRKDIIWKLAKNSSTDVIILTSNLSVTHDWAVRLSKSIYKENNIAGAVPTELIFDRFIEADELTNVLGIDNSVEITDIEKLSAHCIYLKYDFLKIFKNYSHEIFSKLLELAEFVGKKLIKAENVYLGRVTDKKSGERIFKDYEVLKRIRPNNGRKTILYFLLADFQKNSWNNMGGTQLHVKDLTLGLKDKYNIVVVARNNEYLNVTLYYSEEKIDFKFFIGDVPVYQKFYLPQIAELYRLILEVFCVDIVHVHHTLWMNLDIFSEAKKMGIPLIFTAHDYYSICPVLTMVNMEGAVCTECVMTQPCSKCLSTKKNIPESIDYIAAWRDIYETALCDCDMIVAPSVSVKNTFEKYFVSILDKVKVINHGIIVPKDREEREKLFLKDGKLRIAFIGDIGKQKGADLIFDIIQNSNSANFEWFLIGGIGDPQLVNLKQKNLVKHGWYKKKELGEILEKYNIDLVGILSQVPETYCYTFSEAAVNGIPLFVTDIGALGERMRKNNVGWMVPKNSEWQDLLKLLEHIRETPEEYRQKCEGLKKISNISVQDMLSEYMDIYEAFPIKNHRDFREWNKLFEACEPLTVEEINDSDNQNRNLVNTPLDERDIKVSIRKKILERTQKLFIRKKDNSY